MCLGTKESIKEEEQEEIQRSNNHSDLKAVVEALLMKEFVNVSAYLKIHLFVQNSDFCCVIWPYVFVILSVYSKSIPLLVTCIHKRANNEFWTRTS